MYSETISALDDNERQLVVEQMGAWASGACERWRRIVGNVQGETALSLDAFGKLLRDFCSELSRGSKTAEAAWVDACRAHQFEGPVLPPPSPERLGRATPLSSYAAVVSDSPGVGLSPDRCEKLIRKIHIDGTSASPRERRTLQRARLGRHVIWATFHQPAPDHCPFDHLPRTTEAIRTALGLGECSETETLVLLSYRSGGSWGMLELYRPTVAEAGTYCWYCPVSDGTASTGMTRPLDPNPQSLAPQPEVVHREIAGESLVFPLYLAV